MDNTLKHADELIKAGREDEARGTLIQMLKQNPADDEAWVWLASITSDREKRQKCLEEALKHNPNNATAKRVLQKMTAPPLEPQPEKQKTGKPTPMVHVMCGWPLILVFFGGAIGGALGGVAYAANLAIYKSDMPGPLKVILNPLVGILAIALWYLIALWLTTANVFG